MKGLQELKFCHVVSSMVDCLGADERRLYIIGHSRHAARRRFSNVRANIYAWNYRLSRAARQVSGTEVNLIEHLRCDWRLAGEGTARRMKVVGVNMVCERSDCAEIRLGVTRYNIEMKRCCGGRGGGGQRTGCQPIGDRCSLHLGISSVRDRTSARWLRMHKVRQ